MKKFFLLNLILLIISAFAPFSMAETQVQKLKQLVPGIDSSEVKLKCGEPTVRQSVTRYYYGPTRWWLSTVPLSIFVWLLNITSWVLS